MSRKIMVGCLVIVALAAFAIIAAGVSTARADDVELEFMKFRINKKVPINPSTGEFQVKGTVTCQESPYEQGEPSDFSVSGELKQRVGAKLITGSFATGIECTTERRRWSADVIVDDGRFRPGRVSVQAQGCASPPRFIFDCDELSTRIQLKKSKD